MNLFDIKFKVCELLYNIIYLLIILLCASLMISYSTHIALVTMFCKLINLLIVAVCIIYIICNFRTKILYNSIFYLLVILIVHEFCISVIMGIDDFLEAFTGIFGWPLVFIVAANYQRTSKNIIIKKNYNYLYSQFLFFLGIFSIYKANTGTIITGGERFSTYFFLGFSPIVLASVNKKKQYLIFIEMFFLSVISLKRTFFIATCICFVMYFVHKYSISNENNHLKRNVLLFIFFILVGLFLNYMIQYSEFRIFTRLKYMFEDGGSGRIDLWQSVFDGFVNSTWSERLLGHGFQSVYYKLKPTGTSSLAHNSFIEYLYDYGYVGLFYLLFLLILLVPYSLKALKDKYMIGFSYLMSYFLAIFVALLSYTFEESKLSLLTALVWGCYVGLESRYSLDL